ncbi:hypothetical protein JCM16303_003269 [Sporobolomyces ruberrimus]
MIPSPTIDLNKLSDQDLIDYLHTAVSEDDLLFVVYWLVQLRGRNVVSPGLELHSWKRATPLVTAVGRPHSTTRSLILQCLLSETSHQAHAKSKDMGVVRREGEKWARDTLERWTNEGSSSSLGSVKKGRDLLESPSDVVEEWIKRKLPPHPDPSSLTGCKGLPPPRPSSSRLPPKAQAASRPSPLLPTRASPSVFREVSLDGPPLPSNSPPPPPDDSLPRPIFHPFHPAETSADSCCRLYLGSISPQVTDEEIESLLASTSIPIEGLRIVRRAQKKTDVFFSVPSKQEMNHLIRSIDGTRFHGCGQALFIQRAMPERRAPHHFHLVIPNLPTSFSTYEVYSLVRNSRCGPFESRIGYNVEGNWIGTCQVGSREAAEDATDYLKLRGYHRAYWARGPAPVLLPNPPSHDPIIDSLMAKPLDVESWRQVPPSPPTSTSSTTRDAFQTPFSRSTTPPFPPPEDQTIAEPRQDRPAQVLSTPRSPPKANATELEIDTSFCFLKPRHKQPLGFSYKEMFLPIDFSRNRKELEEAKTRATRLDRPTKRSRFE